MDITEILGKRQEPTASDLPENLDVPDYPPTDEGDGAPGSADLLTPDPKPRRDRRQTTRATPAKKATAQEKRQIKDALSLMLLTLGGGISLRDPHCGGAIAGSADNIAEKAVPLIARNPAWVEWFTGTTGFLDVLGLLIALREPASTIWGHHVSHTIGDEHPGGADDLSIFTAPSL